MAVTLHDLIAAMQAIAPPALAEAWDNVGLLIEPTKPRPINRVMLTIDLTQPVLAEAIRNGARAIVAYHPPIFAPLKSLTTNEAGHRIVLGCVEHGIAVYCPHTALDAAPGGVNDWLADGLGKGNRQPMAHHAALPPTQQCKLVVFASGNSVDALREALSAAGAGVIGDYTHCSFNLEGVGTFLGGERSRPVVGRRGRLERVEEVRLEMVCGRAALPAVARAIHDAHPYEEPAWEIYPLEPRPIPGTGQGRIVELQQPVSLATLATRIKRHLKLKHLRVASADRPRKIRAIALCAGAGGSVLQGVQADAYLTGEMRHHDVLAANARGISVILSEHTHTERGYLPTLRRRLAKALGKSVRIDISRQDREPIRIV